MAKAARGFFLWGTVEMGRAGGGAVWKQQTKQAWAASGVAARDDLLGRGTKPRAGRAKRLPDAVAKLCSSPGGDGCSHERDVQVFAGRQVFS